MIDRVSSTPITTFMDCPRKFRRGLEEPLEASEAMSFGTLVHACNELRMEGYEITREAVMAMPGNYDPPSKALEDFPHLWEKALQRHNDLYEWDPSLFEMGCGMIEKDMGDYGLTFMDGKVLASGYLDYFNPAPRTRLIRDWKTRKSFSYAPRTPADFHANIQLCYYAAGVCQIFGWDWVDVQHVNIMRDESIFQKVTVRLSAFYLKGVWEYLDTEIIPAMVAAAAEEDPDRVYPETANCYKYGPCRFVNTCSPFVEYEGQDVLDVMASLLS